MYNSTISRWPGASLLLLASVLLVLLLSSPAVRASGLSVTVNTTGDEGDNNHGDGLCQTGGGDCTLRAALEELNAQGVEPTPHQLQFNIPGSGPHLIAPDSALPNIQVPVIIDGSTQPGASCPAETTPATLQIVLDGGPSDIGVGLALGGGGNADGSIIRGLVIGNFAIGIDILANDSRVECAHVGLAADGLTALPNTQAGIRLYNRSHVVIGGDSSHAVRNVISGNSAHGILLLQPFLAEGDNSISNNYIGTTADGLSPLGNQTGIYVTDATLNSNRIGGSTPLGRNVISGNQTYGLHLNTSELLLVQGNLIGVAADGLAPLPNGWDGIALEGVTENSQIGGLGAGEGNLIAYNADNGILIFPGATKVNNSFRGNQIFANGMLPIDLGNDGQDSNDPLDADDGPNGQQNYPDIGWASSAGQITGTLHSQANQVYEIDFYAGDDCRPGGAAMRTYLGTVAVTTDGDGLATFAVNVGALAPGQVIAAIATDSAGNSSESSPCVYVDGDELADLPYFLSDCGLSNPPPPPPPLDHQTYLPLVPGANAGPPATTPPAGVGPSRSGGQTLVDGGIISGPDGVALGAISGTLTTTLTVAIAPTTAPTATIITTPTVHGNYYQVTASVDVVICDQERGFVLGLPVPAGVPTDSLALASFAPAIADWTFVEGQYDPATNLFLARLGGLYTDGFTSVLIETATSRAQPSRAGTNPTFHIKCYSSLCPQDLSFITDFLDLLYIEMDDMGYAPPHIGCASQLIALHPPTRTCLENSYAIQLVPDLTCAIDGAPSGIYQRSVAVLAPRPNLFLCIDATHQLSNADKRAIRYHYFQAIQLGIPEHWQAFTDWINWRARYNHDDWVLKSTAAAAMISIPTVMESSQDYPRRPVDAPLQSIDGTLAFSAQDFWVFIGRSQAEGLFLLEPLFEHYGSTTEAVVDWLGGQDTFQAFYWNWAKNQALLEDDILLNDADAGAPCQFTGHSEELYWHFYDINEGPIFTEPGEITPLTTHVIELEMDFGLRPVDIQVHDPKTGDDSAHLEYKIYVEAEANCADIPDGQRGFSEAAWDDVLAAGARLFILVANIDPDHQHRYEIVLEAALIN